MHCQPSRYLCSALLFIGIAISGSVPAASSFEYIGQQIIPNRQSIQGMRVGGLSALDYDAASQRYFALSDDGSKARFFVLKLDLNKFERVIEAGMAGVHIEAVHQLRRNDGSAYAAREADPEGIRLHPSRQKLYWSDEGRRSLFGRRAPALIEATLDGHFIRALPLPAHYLPSGSSRGRANGDLGVASNLAFESVAITPDGKTLWTATENSLVQDGPPSDLEHGSPARLLSIDLSTGQASREYIYEVAPVRLAPILPGLLATNGLSDMLALGADQFITLERSFAIGAATPGERRTGMTIRLFHADAREATDVAALPSIVGRPLRKVSKTLLLDLSQLINDDGTPLVVDNLEGLTFGPCHQGKPTLLLISDNNFSPLQFTQIVALAIHDPLLLTLPLPSCVTNKPGNQSAPG